MSMLNAPEILKKAILAHDLRLGYFIVDPRFQPQVFTALRVIRSRHCGEQSLEQISPWKLAKRARGPISNTQCARQV